MNPLHCFNPAVTWASLPPAKRDEIGRTVVAWAFADFVSGAAHAPEDRLCNAEIRDEAERDRDRLVTELLNDIVPASLPEVFGPAGDDPPWAWREAG